MFTAGELDRLEEMAATATEQAGVVSDSNINVIVPSEGRRSKIKWMEFDDSNLWVYDRVGSTVASVNVDHYRFDLSGLFEKLQLTRYEAEDRGHYDWHQDYGTTISRKLSLTLQLTDPESYDGGTLQIMATNQLIEAHKARGLIVVFPAYQLHRVTPVERGVRHSLVAWVTGPAFR